jgi:hypothetical protein
VAHAKRAPSSAYRWINCLASIPMSEGLESPPNEYAANGSVIHHIAEICLQSDQSADEYIGRKFSHDGFDFIVDQEMADIAQDYVEYVVSLGGIQLYEQKLPIGHITLEDGAKGTGDAICIHPTSMDVCDLKSGQNKVYAADNEQLMLYALGAMELYGSVLGGIDTVRLHIIMPRIDFIDTWEVSVAQLTAFGWYVKDRAALIKPHGVKLEDDDFRPSKKACQYCPANGKCKPMADHLLSTIADDFVDLTKPININADREIDNESLANLMDAVPAIEDFCKGIRGRVEKKLFAGEEVPRYKIVQGKKGIRKWMDESKLPQIESLYERIVISPTKAEKLFKKNDIWTALQEHIYQPEGKPSVAHISDKRPALSNLDDFEVIT